MMRLLAALLLLFLPSISAAQAQQCRAPAVLPRPEPVGAAERKPRRMPIAGYSLALSWSPEYCRTRRTSVRDGLQCGGEAGRFGFVLHGLWPEGRAGRWPQFCRPAALVPEPAIRASLCATPSVALIQHEWEKHGSCMADDAAGYLRAATRLYGAVRFPDMGQLSRRSALTAGAFAEAFAAANPGLSAAMLAVGSNRKGWLQEVRLCLGRDLRPRACPRPMREAALRRTLRIWRGG